MIRRLAPLFLLLALAGCDRAPKEPMHDPSAKKTQHERTDGSDPAPAQTEQQGKDAELKAPETGGEYRLKGGPRVVAIGDLHGDFEATERAFRLAGAIDRSGHWRGGKLVVVQTGDQLDRGDDERIIIDFLIRLQKEATKAGGAVHVLNGNHETMNVAGDFRYVTPGALRAFADLLPRSPLAASFPQEMQERAAPFLPGGGAALLFSERPLIAMVGDTVFAHGGVTPEHIDFGIDRLNRESRAWMRGERKTPPAPVVSPEGPVWTRIYGEPEPKGRACAVLEETLRRLGAKRMVVGHTVQQRGLSGACGDKVFRVDVGLARYYGDHPAQVLEIQGDQVKILTED